MRKFYVMAVAAMMATTVAWAQSVVEVTTEAELSSAISNGGYAKLSADITLQSHVAITSGSITLDLNGHTLKRNLSEASDSGNVIRVSRGATLTIMDSSGDNSGKITGGRATNGGGICNHGTLWLYGGTIASNYASNAGGGIYNAPSTQNGTPADFHMTGGVILGNWGGDAGGIYNYSGSSVIINGGAISGNTSNAGGGGLVNYGEAVVSNGVSLNNNHATTRGGGIWNGGELTVSAATVSGNRADIEGGGIWNQGTLSIYGAVNVTGNTKGSGWNSNLFCTSGHFVTITGNLGSASIGISCEGNDGIVTSGLGSYGSLDNFSNDFPDLATMALTDGEVKLTKLNVVYYVERSWDGTKVVQTIKTVPTSQCTFLDGTNNSVVYKTSTGNSYLVVRGTNAAYKTIEVDTDCSLILCDGASLSGIETVPVISIDQNPSLNIYGQMNDSGQLKNGAIWLTNTSTLNIHGGTIVAIGTKATPSSAAIGGYFSQESNVDTSCGLINIYGGTIDATGEGQGAGIGGSSLSRGGTINIYGGTITARGASSSQGNSAAGIGGGGWGYVSAISIYGGTVYAWGGDDAAGIGSGEEDSDLHSINGGHITISGGTVYAYGNDEGAGIGAGQHADMGHITITGGTVYAEGGENSAAIATHDDSEGASSLTIGDQMMVSSGGQPVLVEDGLSTQLLDGRIIAMVTNHAVTIEPCTHSGATTTIVDADSHKIIVCSYCLTGNSTAAHTFGSYGECSACGLVSLNNDADNSSSIAHWNGKTKTVVLSGRTLFKDGSWNTLCLPFNLPIAGSPLDGDDVVVQTLAGSSFNEGALTLNFTSAVTTIEAGKPYLIKWSNGTNIENPMFSNANISNATSNITSDYIDFIGTYSPLAIYQDSDEKTNLYLAGSNKLNYPKDPNYTVNAFRAYFTLKGGLTVGNTTSGVRSFTLNFGDEETSINAPAFNRTGNGDETWYSLDGRRLSGKPTAKGIFLYNGRKVVIK